MGGSPEIWSEDCIVTFTRTDMGWLMSFYDLNQAGWTKIGSFYPIGKGSWLFDDRRRTAETEKVRAHW